MNLTIGRKISASIQLFHSFKLLTFPFFHVKFISKWIIYIYVVSRTFRHTLVSTCSVVYMNILTSWIHRKYIKYARHEHEDHISRSILYTNYLFVSFISLVIKSVWFCLFLFFLSLVISTFFFLGCLHYLRFHVFFFFFGFG